MKKVLIVLWINLFSMVLLGCQFDQVTDGYAIYFDSNGGSYVSSIGIDEEITISMLEIPSKTGYEFDGWYYDNNTFDRPLVFSDILNMNLEENITVYAKWVEIINDSTTELSLYDDQFMSDLGLALEEGESIIGLYGVTVSVHGEMIGEQFYNALKRNLRYNIYSVTKSINSLLVGIAIDLGYIGGVDDFISTYIDISGYENQADLANIKIKHLLTMTDGIYWNSNDLPSEMIDLRAALKPIDMILEREVVSMPGQVFNYSDGAAHLMSYLISSATGMKTNDFAYTYLFEPLGIGQAYWVEDKAGINIGGCDLFLSNYELDILGQMVLNKGVYKGIRIVSEAWIDASTMSPDFNVSFYGYYWWLSETYGLDIIAANGFGGQHIYIVPAYDLVITTLASGNVSGEDANIQYNRIETFILEEVLKLFDDIH